MAVDGKRHTVSAALTDEEYELLEAFAAEQGIDDVSKVLPALLHEVVKLHDQLWDMQFSAGKEIMDAMARQAMEEDRAGLTLGW